MTEDKSYKELRRMDMRYSRLKQRKTKQRYAAFVLVVLLIFAAVYVISAGTLGKFVSSLIAPILSRDGGADATDSPSDEGNPPVLTVPDGDFTNEQAEDTVKITDTLKANPLTMYAIQMGAFTDNSNAEVFAQELRGKGGAGYILNDGFSRVLAIGFQTEEDAKQVKEELKAGGIESHVYKIASAGVDMKIIATEANVSAIRSAYEMWEEKYVSLEKIIMDLDSGTISPLEAYGKIKDTKAAIEEKKNELEALNVNQKDNVILTGLVNLYESGVISLDEILLQSSSDKVAISSKIKYTYIEMLMRYKDYMDQITKQKNT
jgi:hypothetical protein